jgi:hypothetical protein
MKSLCIGASFFFFILIAISITTFFVVNPRIENDDEWTTNILAKCPDAILAEGQSLPYVNKYWEIVGICGAAIGSLYGVLLQYNVFEAISA